MYNLKFLTAAFHSPISNHDGMRHGSCVEGHADIGPVVNGNEAAQPLNSFFQKLKSSLTGFLSR
jgi:hypothetical protein